MKEIIPNGSADIASLTETMTDRFWNMKVIGDNHISDLGTIKLRPYSPIPVLSDSSAIGVSLNDSAFSYHGIGGEVDSLGICASAPLNLCQLSSLTAIQGLFIGIAKKKDNEGVYTDASCSSLLLIKVFLQAYYNSNGSMNACLGSMYPNICDTVLVELHEIDPPYAAVYSSKEILGTDGMLEVLLPSTLNQSYYIILKHRNSLETWSSTPVAINDTLIFYDFSMDASKALGDNQIELSTGIYAIYSGDIINSIVGSNPYQDGIINQADLSKLEEDLISFKTGYQTSDLNGDQIVDQSDYSLLENNLNLGIQVIRP
ncbi:MAG: hypothetical protein IPG39_20750 [Bacteroidetes bacterium]|nr:hypothetical protein [Bacteroidota bacterium]